MKYETHNRYMHTSMCDGLKKKSKCWTMFEDTTFMMLFLFSSDNSRIPKEQLLSNTVIQIKRDQIRGFSL